MSKPKALVLRTAGTNCDSETCQALTLAGAAVSLEHINHLKLKPTLSRYQLIAFPGGFSYGDDLGAGKIFSLEIMLWLKDALSKFIEKGGLAIGICNGFQIMVKTGILPDADFTQKVTLTDNDSSRFEDRWVYLKVEKNPAAQIWLKDLPEIIQLPIAHGEGKFFAEKPVLDSLEAKGQVVLRYCDALGQPSGYPLNPNGALNSIAGITDSSGRIFGLMPHPERCMFEHHIPGWNKTKLPSWGLQIFQNAVTYLSK